MKNGLAFMVLAEPAGFQTGKARLGPPGGVTRPKKDFGQLYQPFGKVGEEFRGYFAFIAAGT